VLTVDDREATQHPNVQELLKPVPTKVERLDSADYAYLDQSGLAVGIERCEVGNLLQKLRDGELETQLTRCEEQYSVIYLLVEGVYDGDLVAVYKPSHSGYFRSHVYPNTRYEYIAGSLAGLDRMGIRIIQAATFECSMKMIKELYKPEHGLFKKIRAISIPVKMSSNPNVPMLMALCKRMPERVAIQLIGKYTNIWTILHTEDKELLEVDGFGKTLLSRFKESVGYVET
jgi:ERCC4-type nuclease